MKGELICDIMRAARYAGIDISPLDKVRTELGNTGASTILEGFLSLKHNTGTEYRGRIEKYYYPYMLLLAIKDTDKFGFQECVVNHLIKIAEKSNGSITSPNALQDRIILQTLIKTATNKTKGES